MSKHGDMYSHLDAVEEPHNKSSIYQALDDAGLHGAVLKVTCRILASSRLLPDTA